MKRPGVSDGKTIGGNRTLPITDLQEWAARRKAGRKHAG